MDVPLCRPYLGKEELERIKAVLDSGWLVHGPNCKQLEKDFAEFIGVKHALTLNSCASALQLALQAKGITGEVIVPSFTFVASANTIVNAGAKPVFAEIDYGTCNIDPAKIEEKITDKTEAIMPVHYAGQPCDMEAIMKIAKEHNLAVIEDSAETLGADFKGKQAGSFGIGCFSFFPTKNMTTGEGGMITTDDDAVADKVKAFKGHGIGTSTFDREHVDEPWYREAVLAGYNYRMCDVLAAIGVVQLGKLKEMNTLRRKHSEFLNKNLPTDYVDLPVKAEGCDHVYQMYTIKVHDSIDRTKFVHYLRDKGVGASVHFDPPAHLHSYYRKNFPVTGLDVTEKVARSIVTLPMFPTLTEEELDYMIKQVEGAVESCRK
ncbi:DegT/DnrJ/EryC1/StrS family aminotransferase [Nanoarchaeota archaeon]